MIIIGSCVGDGGKRFDAVARPSLHELFGPDDLVVTESGSRGICAAYNSIIALARSRPDLHDDVDAFPEGYDRPVGGFDTPANLERDNEFYREALRLSGLR